MPALRFLAATALLGATLFASLGAAPTTDPARLRVVLVGDSTVTDKSGWGLGFARAFDPTKVEVINASAGGRSSKSFRDEKLWAKALAHGGDYMLIQFGHNDQPGKGPERETDAKTTFVENMERYVREAREAGFRPILVTSLVRRRFQPDGTIKSDLLDYVAGTKKAAQETGAPLIDLHALSIQLCEKLGPARCDELAPKDAAGKVDSTHLKGDGEFGRLVGDVMAEEFVKVAPEAKPALKPSTQPAQP